jgi:hypothetical protein
MNFGKYKTRQQMADELGMSRITFWRRLKDVGLGYFKGLLSPKQQIEIVKALTNKDDKLIKKI